MFTLLSVLLKCLTVANRVRPLFEDRRTADNEANSRRTGQRKADTHIDKHVDTLEKARQSLKDQGDYEMEVTYGGEADLRLHAGQCDKNPGHANFIALRKFSVDNLPCGFRDDLIVDWIRAQADLTCRLLVGYISEKRPKFIPGTTQPYPFYNHRGGIGRTMLRTGTGWVLRVEKFTESDNKPCQCWGCTILNMATPKKKEWGYIYIKTAAHVVYDEKESVGTQCRFFYDDDEVGLNNIRDVSGLEVTTVIEADHCKMRYPTHDMDLINKLAKMLDRHKDLCEKVRAKYRDDQDYNLSSPSTSRVPDPSNYLCAIVSHPHGCPKQVSLGQLTQKLDTGKRIKWKYEEGDGNEYDMAYTQYAYSTPTCRGSSGARVLSPHSRWAAGVKGWCPLVFHTHSQGLPGNKNKSAVYMELV